MRNWEEINRQENQCRIWRGEPGIYEEPFPIPDRAADEYQEQWQRRFNAKWENLKRHGHSKGNCGTDASGAAADDSLVAKRDRTSPTETPPETPGANTGPDRGRSA